MLEYNLKKLYKMRGIEKPMRFLMKNGFTKSTANTLASRKQKAIKTNVIERLCEVFKCTPNELMEWTPDTPEMDNAEHPLYGLKKETEVYSFKELTENMTIREIKEAADRLRRNVNPVK